MKKQVGAIFTAALLLFALGGCGPSSGSQETPGANSSQIEGTKATEDDTAVRGLFLPEQEESYDKNLKPSVAAFTIEPDFSNVINYEGNAYAFRGDVGRKLLENGFVVTSGYNEEFFGLYETNRYKNMPSFITTDAMMHTYHLFFSRLLKGIEKESFYQDLIHISGSMQKESLSQLQLLRGTEWENAAKRNAAFFSVGLALLRGDQQETPAEVGEFVSRELALIEGAAGITASPVMSMGSLESSMLPLEDYSQYIPRGYYTTSEELTRYFQAMMWYGRLSFRQNDDDQSRSALLMTMALKDGGAMEKWERIYSITGFFVGASDDPGVYEYASAITESYGEWPLVEKLPRMEKQWEAFQQAAAALPPPVINSIPIYDKSIQENREEAIRAFRFMGQRSTLDAAIFQRLVYREVEENSGGERRMLPAALDIPSALGSKTAGEILKESGAEDYAGYSENMAAIQSYLKDAPQTLWNGSLYGGWLNTLRPLTQEKGEGYPPFMQNRAWSAKSLNTFLGSWTELKHDTVLYAKQVYAEMGGGGYEEADDRGYVEPEPVLYGRLSALSRATVDGLGRYGVLRDSDAENLGRLAELAERLMVISEKELRDELLDDEEYELIRTFGGQLEHFWYEALKDEKNGEEILSTDFPAAVITDVATDPNGSVLEVGSGRIDNLYVIVNVGGSLRIAKGGVFSFYEFKQPIGERLTDEKWRQMLGIDPSFDEEGNWTFSGMEVPRPGWVSLFLADPEKE